MVSICKKPDAVLRVHLMVLASLPLSSAGRDQVHSILNGVSKSTSSIEGLEVRRKRSKRIERLEKIVITCPKDGWIFGPSILQANIGVLANPIVTHDLHEGEFMSVRE